jgi:cation transport regulator
MLYQTNQDLPLEVRSHLDDSAQELYRAAFNCAIHWYGDEDRAHKVARAAVRMQAVNLNQVIYKPTEVTTQPQLA